MLKQDFGYNITDDNVLKVNIANYIEKRYNTSGLNITLATLDLMSYLPKQEYAFELQIHHCMESSSRICSMAKLN